MTLALAAIRGHASKPLQKRGADIDAANYSCAWVKREQRQG